MSGRYEMERVYEPGREVLEAQKAWLQQAAQKPGEFYSDWTGKRDALYSQYENRQPFRYDAQTDPLFRQYKNQYIHNGQLAMQNAMGQAAALTGGYGSSYGQSVGQQTYQNYLTGLTDKIPELAALAQDRYDKEGQALLQQYSMAADRENQDYNRYRQGVADWQTDRNYLRNVYNQERDLDYSRWGDEWNRDYQLNQDRQTLAQTQVEWLWQNGVRPSDELLAAAGYDASYIAARNPAVNAVAEVAYYGGSGGETKNSDYDLVKLAKAAKAKGATDGDINNIVKTEVEKGNAGYTEATNALKATQDRVNGNLQRYLQSVAKK